MYSNRFVMTVIVDGKPLQERADGTVAIPFGAEYSIRFKNKNDRRAVVKFYIDGENVSGGGYIISAHGTVDIQRHHDVDRAFRFVELNSDEAILEGKGGPNLDGSKGVIEARFHLEKQSVPYQPVPMPIPVPIPYNPAPVWMDGTYPNLSNPHPYKKLSRICRSKSATTTTCSTMPTMSDCFVGNSGLESASYATPLNEGCTVEGTSTGQNFTSVYFNEESDYVTLRVVLRGHKVTEAVVAESEEAFCTKCGQKRSRKSDRFCGKCGGKY